MLEGHVRKSERASPVWQVNRKSFQKEGVVLCKCRDTVVLSCASEYFKLGKRRTHEPCPLQERTCGNASSSTRMNVLYFGMLFICITQ